MTTRHELPPGTTLRVTTSSGDITVVAERRDDVTVPEGAHVEMRGGEGPPQPASEERPRRRRRPKHKALRILRHLVRSAAHMAAVPASSEPAGPVLHISSGRGGSRDITVRCPVGIAISVGTISGDVRLEGEFGQATVTTTSGDVRVESAAALDVRSISGDLEVEACAGLCRLHTKSGHIQADVTGPADAHSVSGRVRLRRTSGEVTVRTISGNIELDTDGSDTVKVRTVSGKVRVGVAGGRQPDARLRSLSGKIRCDCPLGGDFLLSVESVSGGIEVGES